MAKVQEELGKMFKTFGSDFDDERLEKFIEDSERIMRRPAELLLRQAGLDTSLSKSFSLLDHACGTGPIAAHLQANVHKQVLSQSRMLCADISDNLVNTLRRRAEKHGWISVETAVLDAQNSGLPELSFSHITVNFAMHVIPEPELVLQEAMRLLQPGGTLAFTVWHKNNLGWVPDMASSFAALPFEAPMPSPMPMAPNGKTEFIDPDLIPGQLRGHGFDDVEVKTVEHMVRVESADDYMRKFEMMKEWMIQAYWSEESKEKAKGMLHDYIVRHLTEKHRGQGWDLSWKAVLVTCRKPKN